MMTIGSISGFSSISLSNISAVYNREQENMRHVAPVERKDDSQGFGEVLEDVQKAESEGRAGEMPDNMTLAEVMPNGSLLVQKVDGRQLVDEQMLDVARIQEQFNLQGMPGQVFRAYMAGMGIATAPVGATFNAFI